MIPLLKCLSKLVLHHCTVYQDFAINPSTLWVPFQYKIGTTSPRATHIHLVEIKHCGDTRPQNQLNAVKEQHKDLCNILQGASVTLHIIILRVGGTIYNTHTLKPFKELGLDSQRVKKPPSSMCTYPTSRNGTRTTKSANASLTQAPQNPPNQ
jgi:hypothetical protein